MEFEVRLVGGIDNCFVSLPLDLIQSLHFSSPSLPRVLALELRFSSTDHRWNVAWSGATSASQAIEVARQFGDCISSPDGARVQVRAFSNVPKATLSQLSLLLRMIGRFWSLMLAEAAILNQVRILHEEMRFPLRLNGRTNGGSDRKDNREAIVGLLISDSVVTGHVMIQLPNVLQEIKITKGWSTSAMMM